MSGEALSGGAGCGSKARICQAGNAQLRSPESGLGKEEG